MSASAGPAAEITSAARIVPRPSLRRIGRIVSSLLVVGMVLLAGAVTLVPALAGATAYTVLSGSMAPALPPGSVAIVRPAPAESIQVGDIITFVAHDPNSSATREVTHRVVGVQDGPDGPLFSTRGDASEDPDHGLTTAEQVRGVVWYHVPLVGYLREVLLGPVGMFYLAGALFVLVAAHLLTLPRSPSKSPSEPQSRRSRR